MKRKGKKNMRGKGRNKGGKITEGTKKRVFPRVTPPHVSGASVSECEHNGVLFKCDYASLREVISVPPPVGPSVGPSVLRIFGSHILCSPAVFVSPTFDLWPASLPNKLFSHFHLQHPTSLSFSFQTCLCGSPESLALCGPLRTYFFHPPSFLSTFSTRFFFYKITKFESQPGCSEVFGRFQAQMILKCS